MKAKEAIGKTIYTVEPYNCRHENYFLVPVTIDGHRQSRSYKDENEAKAAADLHGSKVIRLQPRLINCDYRVEKNNLYDFVMASAEETTSPIGVSNVLHIRHEGYYCRYGRLNAVHTDDGNYEVWRWTKSGKGEFIQAFDTEDEAEDFIFERTYDYDFMKDDQRDTSYYDYEAEAEAEIINRYIKAYCIDENVATNLLHHQGCRDRIIEARKNKVLEAARVNRDRKEAIAHEYAKMVERIDGENYKETAARLSAAIGERIESSVFHLTVKMIRNK